MRKKKDLRTKNGKVPGKATILFYNTTYTWYFQDKGPWASKPYWDGTIASDGCGPCSVATIISGFGAVWSPTAVTDYMQNELGLRPGDGSDGKYRDKLQTVMHNRWVNTYEYYMNGWEIKSHIASNDRHPILVCMGPGVYTSKRTLYGFNRC